MSDLGKYVGDYLGSYLGAIQSDPNAISAFITGSGILSGILGTVAFPFRQGGGVSKKKHRKNKVLDERIEALIESLKSKDVPLKQVERVERKLLTFDTISTEDIYEILEKIKAIKARKRKEDEEVLLLLL